jgi:hypothetical protein
MKVVSTLFMGACAGLLLWGCSGGEQQEQLEVSQDGKEVEVIETEEGVAQEALGQESAEGEVLGEEGSLESEEGELSEEIMGDSSEGAEGMEPIAYEEPASTGDSLGIMDESVPAPAVPAPAATSGGGMSMTGQASATATVAGLAMGREGYMVLYAMQAGKMFDSPSASGNVVAPFQSGDHFLVTIEGSWAKINNSAYIPADQLGSRPMAYERTNNAWR